MKPFVYLLLFCLITAGLAEPFDVTSVRLADDVDGSLNLEGSVAGGTFIKIYADGTAGTTASDFTITVGDYICEIPAEGILDDGIVCETTNTGSTSTMNDQPITIYYNM